MLHRNYRNFFKFRVCKNTMKICQIGTGAEPVSENSTRAVEIVIYNLSKELAELGNEVHIIDMIGGRKNKKLKYHLVNLPFLKAGLKEARGFPRLIKKITFSIKPFLLLLKLQKRERFDIVHVQNQFPGFLILLFKKLLKVNGVYTSHIPFWTLNRDRFSKKLLFKTFLERICLKKADKVIAVSQAQKDGILEKVKIRPGKIQVIQNGVDLKKFYPKKKEDKEKIVLYAARLCREKNQFLIIKAIPEIVKKEKKEKVKFLFIGQIEDKDYFEEIMKFIRKNKIEEYVEILGSVDNKSMAGHYRNADIFLSSSNVEGFPLTALEAMASGCAMVLSKIKPHSEIEKNGEIIYFEPDNLKDLIEKLNLLVGDRNKIKKFSKKALDSAKKFYSWKKVASKNMEIYSRVKEPFL